jgi:glycosyltransferase involved in cell wall biosynthesis
MKVPAIRALHLTSTLQVDGAGMTLLSHLRAARQRDDLSLVAVVLNNVYHESLREQLLSLGGPTYFLQRPPQSKHPKYLKQLLKLIDEHRIQLIHVQDNESKLFAIACRALRPGLRVVVTLSGTHMLDPLPAPMLWLHKAGVDGHIAASRGIEQECRHFGLRKVKTVSNGIHLSRFTPKIANWLPGERRLRLIQAARFDLGAKGQDILLQALRQCLDVGLPLECTLMGMVHEGAQQDLKEIQDLVQRLNLARHVTLLTNRIDVPAVLPEHDLFLHPTRQDSSGVALMEAMASGLPVIASDLSGAAEVVRHGENGLLFMRENVDELAQTLCQLVQNPELIPRFSVAGQETAHAHNIEAMTEGYVRYYAEILSIKTSLRLIRGPLYSPNPG